jgi:hypothetical protein
MVDPDSTRINVIIAHALSLLFVVNPSPFVPLATSVWFVLLPLTLTTAVTFRKARILIVASGVTFLLAAYTDHQHHVADQLRVIGIAQLVGFLVFFVSYLWMTVVLSARELVGALISFASAWFISVILFFPLPTGYSIWKYGLAAPVGLLAVLVGTAFWQRGRPRAGLLIIAICGALMSLTNFRSYSFILFLTALLTFSLNRRDPSKLARRRSRIHIASILLLALLLFSLAAGHGILGAQVERRWVAQGGNPLSVVSSGRPDLLFSTAIVMRHIITGVGTRGQLPPEEIAVGAAAIESLDPPQKATLLARLVGNGLNVHSVIFQYWMQYGMTAAVPFILCASWAMWTIISMASRVASELGPLIPFAAAGLIWDLLFSPWTYFTGPVWAIYVALTVFAISANSKRPLHE